MGTNKDQAQAQAFMLGRVIAALTVHETDPEQQPFRRPLMAAIGGIVVGALVLAGFWVFGLLVPGGDRFAGSDVIIVEEETGARYVRLNGTLHPVVNYTSGLLALDRHAEVETVSRARLAGIPVGQRIGIPGAPDSLPGKEQLLTDAWSMCDVSTMDDQGRRGDAPVLLVGQPPEASPLNVNALLVHAGGGVYLVHDGYRHEVAAGADVALQLGGETPVTVDGTWLDTVPAGTPIGPVPLADAGSPSAAVPGRPLVTGQLLELDDGGNAAVGTSYFLVLADALAPISPLQAAVQRVLGPHAEPPVVVTNRDLLDAVRAAPAPPGDGDPPRVRPRFLTVDDPNVTVCATFEPGSAVPSVVVGATLPSGAGRPGSVRVVVPAGQAALVRVMSSQDEQAGLGTVALVTDQGKLFPLVDPAHVAQVLGYDGVSPVRIPAALVDRVPRGEPLSPEEARRPVADG